MYRLRCQHDIKTLCRVLNVNRSTYYKHFFSEPAPRTVYNRQIKVCILEIYSSFDKSIGAYKIRRVLERDYGISISVGRVYRLMATMDLPKMSTDKPKYKASHDDNGPCVNHLRQNFSQQAPDTVWASDFTYVKVNGRGNYLCVVLDLFSRRVIGWHTASRHNTDLTMTAFKKAYGSRGCPQNVLFHSDRGSGYTSYKFRQLLDECSCLPSFSKKGCPYDNACLESFFKQMKRDELNRRTFHSLEEFRLSCFKYIERYYNRRPHSSLGNLTPVEVENKYWSGQN